jgi:copper transport protein
MAAAPPLIELEFSEPLEPGYSRVQLLDSHSRLVDAGPGQVDRANPRLLRLNLAPLAADSYTAAWRVRSTADGHITRGSIPFGVGVPVSAVSLLPPPGAPEPATELPGPWAPMLRWLGLVAAAVALGGLPFGWIVWRPTVRALAEDGVDWSAADAAMTGWVQRLTVGGGAALVVLGVLFLFQQAAAAAEVSLARALGEPLGALLGGRTGQLLVGRILLAGLVAVAGARLPALADGRPGRWLAALGLGAGLLLATSLGAHAAAVAPRPGLAVAADWWHLVAMVAWLGGLVPLALALRAAPAWPEPRTGLALLVRRFTRLAYGCVAILLVTGAFSMRLHLGGVEPLWTTTYGGVEQPSALAAPGRGHGPDAPGAGPEHPGGARPGHRAAPGGRRHDERRAWQGRLGGAATSGPGPAGARRRE